MDPIALLENKKIVLGVTGSIAAYKAADLASQLAQAGALVDVIHRFGASVLVRDVEREEDVTTAVRAGADLVQGHYLAEPSRSVDDVGPRAAGRLQHPGYAW